MRNAKELATDLVNLTSTEWNIRLSEEYEIPYEQFIQLVNNYGYTATSEDSIHRRMRPIHTIKKDGEKQQSREEYQETSNTLEENIIKMSSFVRTIGAIFVDPGYVINQMLMCGFICENSELSNILIKNSVFNNCIMTASNFVNSRIVQSKFIDCDFSSCDLRNTIITKSQFYECVFNEAQLSQLEMFDVVLYKCQFQHADSDDISMVTTTIHDCDFSNSHMKRAKILSGVLSYSHFNNTILTEAELFDTHLISIDLSKSDLKGLLISDCPSTSVQIDPMYASLLGIQVEDENSEESSLEDNLAESTDGDDESEEDSDDFDIGSGE